MALSNTAGKEAIGTSGMVTYRRIAKTWSVVSGRNKNGIFYEKILLENGIVRMFVLTYPPRQFVPFNAVSARLAECFHAVGGQ